MEESRFVSSSEQPDDSGIDSSLRPATFQEFVGQPRVVSNLQLAIEAQKKRSDGSSLDHVLLSGPPGLGKTTLAAIIASEIGVHFHSTSGPVIDKAGDIAGILTGLEPRDVLFIDEVHRLPVSVEEVLYSAMEDFSIDIVLGKGPAARSIKIDLPRFTLIAATTRSGLIASPLRARFGISHRLDHYAVDEMAVILKRAAGIFGMGYTEDGINEMASRSRGTPRVANRLLRRVRDYADVKGDGTATLETVRRSLEMLEVDPLGLDAMDRRILMTIVDRFDGGPVGIDSISVAVSEEPGTIEEVYEPYLIQVGMIKRTPRGRMATARAFEYLGASPRGNLSLFQE